MRERDGLQRVVAEDFICESVWAWWWKEGEAEGGEADGVAEACSPLGNPGAHEAGTTIHYKSGRRQEERKVF